MTDLEGPTNEEKKEKKNPLCVPHLRDWAKLEKDFETHRPYKSIRGKPSKKQLELARQECCMWRSGSSAWRILWSHQHNQAPSAA